MKIILSRQFLRNFLISFSAIIVLLTLQFIIKYAEDIFNKGFPSILIIKLIFHSALSFLGTSISFGVLLSSILTFKIFSSRAFLKFKKELTTSMIIVVGLALLTFTFNNWALTKSKLEMMTLLYEMRTTKAGEELKDIDKQNFQDSHVVLNIKKLNTKIGEFDTKIDNYRNQCDSILSILPDSIAKANYSNLNLKSLGIDYKYSTKDTLDKKSLYMAERRLTICERSIAPLLKQKNVYLKEKNERFMLPIELIIFYIIGASFGFFYNNQKSFLLVILGLYTFSFFYGTTNGFYNIIPKDNFGETGDTIVSLLIPILTTLVFLLLAMRKEKNNYAT